MTSAPVARSSVGASTTQPATTTAVAAKKQSARRRRLEQVAALARAAHRGIDQYHQRERRQAGELGLGPIESRVAGADQQPNGERHQHHQREAADEFSGRDVRTGAREGAEQRRTRERCHDERPRQRPEG